MWWTTQSIRVRRIAGRAYHVKSSQPQLSEMGQEAANAKVGAAGETPDDVVLAVTEEPR